MLPYDGNRQYDRKPVSHGVEDMMGGGEVLVLWGSLLIDRLIGDPASRYHPVAIIGRLISILEQALRCPRQSPRVQQVAGACMVIMVLATTYGLVWFLSFLLAGIHPYALFAGQALIVSFAITPRSLAEAASDIRLCLESGDIAQARYKVSRIVGRDTDSLDEEGITRATVETVAENIVDGIIAPLVYFAIGGAPLAFLYRAVNTLDSMVGYKNETYRHFGMVAARVDDAFNYFPARLTGLLIVAAAALHGHNAEQAARITRRDAARHPSPNSGIPEAAVAGALGIRLGGLNYYGGEPSFRAYMGDSRDVLAARHVAMTVGIMNTVTLMCAACITLIFLW